MKTSGLIELVGMGIGVSITALAVVGSALLALIMTSTALFIAWNYGVVAILAVPKITVTQAWIFAALPVIVAVLRYHPYR